jgi:hypothetical protein
MASGSKSEFTIRRRIVNALSSQLPEFSGNWACVLNDRSRFSFENRERSFSRIACAAALGWLIAACADATLAVGPEHPANPAAPTLPAPAAPAALAPGFDPAESGPAPAASGHHHHHHGGAPRAVDPRPDTRKGDGP